MTLSDISIKNPVFAWMLMTGLIFFGAISFNRTGISQMPDVDYPIVTIDITYEGAAPEVIETDVIDVIEDAIMNVEGIEEVRSTAYHSRAEITVELDIDRDVDVALQEINSKVSQSQRFLPREMDPPIITKRNPEDFPIIWLSLTSKHSLRDLMVYARYTIKDKFQTIKGVGDVRLGGYVDRNIRIWVDRKKLNRYELTVDDILRTIGREHVEVPGGRIETSRHEFIVRSKGEAATVKSLKLLPITSRGNSPIYRKILLGDVAEIEDSLDDIRRISRFDGRLAVGMGIMKQRKSNTIEVAREVKKMVADLKKKMPEGYSIDISNDMTRYIEDSTHELVFALILSAILTGIVCFLFLGSLSSTINILLAIPTSIMGTFILIYFFGFTLNTFTLLALSLAIGIVVDDAIMVLENISRYHEMGESRIRAAMQGARQITFAALAATLAIIAIFLPVAFMSGIIGKFFLQFGFTISVAVLLSLLEALTLTPMRCSQFLMIPGKEGRLNRVVSSFFGVFSSWYGRILRYALNHRILTILIASAIFILTFLLLVPIKKEFIPPQDQSMFILQLKTPVGSSIEYTDSLTKKVEAYLASREEVAHRYVAVGGFRGGETNSAIMFVTLKKPEERPIDPIKKRPLSQSEFASVVRKEVPRISRDLRITIQDLSTRGFTARRGFPVEFSIRGPDWNKLGEFSRIIQERMMKSGKLVDVDTSYELGQPEIQVIPDRRAAELRGVSMESIGNTVGALIGGKREGKFTDEGHRFDIRVRLRESERKRADDIETLYVRNNRGELVRLSEVVNIVNANSLLSITRLNRERSITINANPASEYSQQEAIEESMMIAEEVLTDGYYVELSGQAKASKESFQSLLFALVIGIIISYMILASQFNSFIHPFTILLALPFSFSGAIITLLITGNSINMYSFIGLILLMGLVKKNSILLVEFTNKLRDEGLSVREALLGACPVRLRPIIMTSLSTIAAAIPPALALGPGSETRIPMALCVLGGMIFSTLLTLVVVPCAYSLLSRWERKSDFAEK